MCSAPLGRRALGQLYGLLQSKPSNAWPWLHWLIEHHDELSWPRGKSGKPRRYVEVDSGAP
jgi:hypothetical protein